jgi:hypothetical protein
MPFELTNGDPPKEVRKRREHDPVRISRLWDASYRKRIGKWPVFLATEAEFIDLNNPPQLGDPQMMRTFGRIPSTEPARNHPPTATEFGEPRYPWIMVMPANVSDRCR